MSKVSEVTEDRSVVRADPDIPLWCGDLAVLLADDIPRADLADFLGLDWSGPRDAPEPDPLPPPKAKPTPAEPPADAPAPDTPLPKPRFLLPVATRILQPIPPKTDNNNPMTDEELAVPWGTQGVPHQHLCPWPRLGPQLRRRLASPRRRSRLDLRQLLRRVGQGEPILDLPRLRALGWTRDLLLLWDQSDDMAPFQEDVRDLVARLRRALGGNALHVHQLPAVPRADALRAAPGAPVLLVSTLGFQPPADTPAAAPAPFEDPGPDWNRLGTDLQHRGHPLHALVPLPRAWWDSASAGPWPLLEWRAGSRLPRAGGQSSLPASPLDYDLVRELLLHLAPAPFVQPALLRAARRALGSEADTGTEFLAWFHPDGRWGRDAFAFDPATNAARLDERALRVGDPALATVDDLIRAELARCGRAIAWESHCRLDPAAAIEDVLGDLERMVQRLRQHARDLAAPDAAAKGLRRWFPEMVRRLPSHLHRDKVARNLIAEGLALSHFASGTGGAPLPGVVDSAAYLEHLRGIQPGAVAGGPRLFTLADDALRVGPLPPPGEPARELFRMEIAADRLLVRGLPGEDVREVATAPDAPVSIDLPPRLADPLWVTSAFQETLLMPIDQPEWATGMGVDRFGTWAEFEVGPVTVKLRWIPPGRFRMGKGEEAKETLVEHGFWMAETPCTQALWFEVMGNNPSYFPESAGGLQKSAGLMRRALDRLRDARGDIVQTGEDWMRLPVEQVEWNDCHQFFEALKRRVLGLQFGLPKAFQWDYASRAGSEIESTRDLDSTFDSLVTHPVAAKRPNSWGLYDLHDNVWEWCAGRSPNRPEARGGSWLEGIRTMSYRFENFYFGPPFHLRQYLGFRLLAGRAKPPPEALPGGAKTGGAKPTIRLWSANAELPAMDGLPVSLPARPLWWPVWADAADEDGFGRWAAFDLAGVDFYFRWIEPGIFWMGSPKDEEGRWEDEGSRHEVTLSSGFWLAETPMTQAQWLAVMPDNPSSFKGAERPVERVSWNDCQEMLRQLNPLRPGLGADLPTEAQWEFACRAGTDSAYNNGRDDGLDELGWFFENCGFGTHPVGRKAPNAWGLYDMHGNVDEWCKGGQRWYTKRPVTDPLGPQGAGRVIRGGSWGDHARRCRSASRREYDRDVRFDYLGLRLAAGL